MSCTSGRLFKNNRLTRPSEFKAVFDSSFRSRDDLLLILTRRNSLNRARLGLVISKKHVRTAVGRNRIKRVIRESFRHNHCLLRGLDVVVMLVRSVDHKSNRELTGSLETHWREIIHCRNS